MAWHLKILGFLKRTSLQTNWRWVSVLFFANLLGNLSLPTFAYSQCAWDANSGGACTFTQGSSTDNCTTSSSAASTEAINQFYSYGGSGVSVLYCGGSTAGASASPQVITMQCSPPAGATIQAAFLDVVEYNSNGTPSPSTGAVVLGGKTTSAGTMTGIGNLWNIFDDPRYGISSGVCPPSGCSYPDQTAYNIRYNVTGDVSLNTNSYTVTYPNIGSNTA